MDNSLLKILLAALLARQKLQHLPEIEEELANNISGKLDLLSKQSQISGKDVAKVQAQLDQLFLSNQEWQQQYEKWLTRLNNVKITPDWSPTKKEFEEVIRPQILGDGKPYHHKQWRKNEELKNTLTVIDGLFQKVLTGNKPSKPELSSWWQLPWWQKINRLISKN